MKKIPPHLPVASCNLVNHRTWLRLKSLLIIIFFSMITAIAGASVVMGWLWPTWGGGEIMISSRQQSVVSKKTLEDIIKKEIVSRIVSVYKVSSRAYGVEYLKDENMISEAVVVSSDGWIALYSPIQLSPSNLVIYTSSKNIYSVEKVVFDKYTNINYLKIKLDDTKLKVINFATDVKSDDDLFVYNNNVWEYNYIKGEYYSNKNLPLNDVSIYKLYNLNTKPKSGQIVINNQGRMVGVVNSEGSLFLSTYINRSLSKFIKEEAISYPSFGIKGWYSFQQPIFNKGKSVDGFFVNTVVDVKSKLLAGDVIIEINGIVVEKADLWYIINNNKEVDLKILRNSKEITIKSPIVIIK